MKIWILEDPTWCRYSRKINDTTFEFIGEREDLSNDWIVCGHRVDVSAYPMERIVQSAKEYGFDSLQEVIELWGGDANYVMAQLLFFTLSEDECDIHCRFETDTEAEQFIQQYVGSKEE